jgi:trehalose 6-phosphate synthase/phosphatase
MQLLKSLCDDARNTCVVVSGRDKETLHQWFGELAINLVAEHGTWIKEVNSEWTLPSLAGRKAGEHASDWKMNLLPIIESYADRLPGAYVEEKEHSIAWHYRNADPEQGGLLAREMMDHLVSFTANIDIQVLRGHKVIEIRGSGANKGSAAMRWVSRGTYDFILALGDDWTDEDLFMVLPSSAYSIRIGVTNTHARFNFRGPTEVVRLLSQLVKVSNSIPIAAEGS